MSVSPDDNLVMIEMLKDVVTITLMVKLAVIVVLTINTHLLFL
jgi:hypothetical protein